MPGAPGSGFQSHGRMGAGSGLMPGAPGSGFPVPRKDGGRLRPHAGGPGVRGALQPALESRPGISRQDLGAGSRGSPSPGPQAGDPPAFGGRVRTGPWQPGPPRSHAQSSLPAPEAVPPTCGCRAAILLRLIAWLLARPGSGPGPQATGWALVLPTICGYLRAEDVGPHEHPQTHKGHAELIPKVKASSTVILFNLSPALSPSTGQFHSMRVWAWSCFIKSPRGG